LAVAVISAVKFVPDTEELADPEAIPEVVERLPDNGVAAVMMGVGAPGAKAAATLYELTALCVVNEELTDPLTPF